MQIEDPILEAISPAAQATLGKIATAHPWIAGACVVAVVIGGMLGLVSGLIRPESLSTPRKRAGARIALRYGLAVRGSLADFKALFTGIEETPATSDPLVAAAASSLSGQPVPTELLARVDRLPGYGHPGAPAPLPPPAPVPMARVPSARAIPREDPASIPPPAPRPASLRRLPSEPGRRVAPAAFAETIPARQRRHTPFAGSVADPESDPAATTPPEVPRSKSGQHDDLRPPTPRPQRGRS